MGASLGRAARTAGARVSGTGFAGVGFAGLGSVAATVVALQDKDLTIGSALLGLTAAWAAAALVVVLAADGLEARRRADPARLATAVPVLLGIAAIGIALAASLPSAAGALAAAGVVAAATGLAAACLDVTAMSSAEPADRAAVAALATCSVLGGAVLAVLWVNFAANRFDGFVAFATLSLAVAACAAASTRLPKAATTSFQERLDGLAFRLEVLHGDDEASAAAPSESAIPAWLLAPPPLAAPPPTWPPTVGWHAAPMPPPAAPWTPAPPMPAPSAALDPLNAPFEEVVAAAQAEHLAELAGTPTVFDPAPTAEPASPPAASPRPWSRRPGSRRRTSTRSPPRSSRCSAPRRWAPPRSCPARRCPRPRRCPQNGHGPAAPLNGHARGA